MTAVPSTVLDAIGNTPIVQLRRVVPPGSARILAKLEFANPTGGMKDRVAKAMVEAAERDGRLRPGGTVVEFTGGEEQATAKKPRKKATAKKEANRERPRAAAG